MVVKAINMSEQPKPKLSEDSYQRVPNILINDIQSGKLNCTDIAVYMICSGCQRGTSPSWPSKKTVAEMLGVSEKTVERSFRNLALAGHMTQSGKTKSGTKDTYLITRVVGDKVVRQLLGNSDSEEKARQFEWEQIHPRFSEEMATPDVHSINKNEKNDIKFERFYDDRQNTSPESGSSLAKNKPEIAEALIARGSEAQDSKREKGKMREQRGWEEKERKPQWENADDLIMEEIPDLNELEDRIEETFDYECPFTGERVKYK